MYYNTDTRSTEEIVASEYPFWSYVRTDRNGTRYFANYKCDRCNGKGVIPYYGYIDGGVCFECGGSGRSKARGLRCILPLMQKNWLLRLRHVIRKLKRNALSG